MGSTRDNSATTESRNQPAPAFTPGPWGFQRDDGTIYARDGDVEPRIATIEYDNTSDAQYFADGRLIAAAPDLLAALIGMADAYVALLLIKAEDPSRFKEPGSPYANALAAIKQAQGAQS